MLEVLYQQGKFGMAWTSPFTGVTKGVEFFVCVSITLLNNRVFAHDFALKALEYRNDFDTFGSGKVCSCAPIFNFLCMPPIGDTTNYYYNYNRFTALLDFVRD